MRYQTRQRVSRANAAFPVGVPVDDGYQVGCILAGAEDALQREPTRLSMASPTVECNAPERYLAGRYPDQQLANKGWAQIRQFSCQCTSAHLNVLVRGSHTAVHHILGAWPQARRALPTVDAPRLQHLPDLLLGDMPAHVVDMNLYLAQGSWFIHSSLDLEATRCQHPPNL